MSRRVFPGPKIVISFCGMHFAGKDFLSMAAPPGYKAGVGRGAVGFSTTAERGGSNDALVRQPPQYRGKLVGVQDATDVRFLDASANAFEHRISSRAARENKEAEAIYASIDAKMVPKRAKKRASPANSTGGSKSSPSSDANLQSISIDEWASIPDAADFTRRNKRLREEERQTKRNYAVPDSLLLAQQSVEQQLADIHKRRLMLESMIRAEPHNPDGFLGLARLEREASRHKIARLVIEKGTLLCPRSPEVWLESLELHPVSAEARAIAAKACRACPQSESLWLRAIDLEPTSVMKAQVAHEALLHCSESTELWLTAAKLESNPAEKEQVLRTAVEFVPSNEILWLARIEASSNLSGTSVQEIVSEASRQCSSMRIWLIAARNSTDSELYQLATEAVANKPREELLSFLFSLSAADARIIAQLSQALALNESDLEGTNIVEGATDIIYAALPKTEGLYVQWTRKNPTVLKEAVSAFPQSSTLWREYINAGGDVEAAIKNGKDLDNELISVAVNSLLRENKLQAGTQVLEKWSLSPSLVLQLVELYEYSGQSEKALARIRESLKKWPDAAALYVAEAALDPSQASSYLKEGLRSVPLSDTQRPLVWRALVQSTGPAVRKRALLSQALREHKQSGELWLERVKLEKTAGTSVVQVLSDALRECNTYGPLWCEAILAEPANLRKKKLAEAVKATDGDASVLLAGALIFISSGQDAKAKDWFANARARDPCNGDILLWMYKYGVDESDALSRAVGGGLTGAEWSKARRSAYRDHVDMREAMKQAACHLENAF